MADAPVKRVEVRVVVYGPRKAGYATIELEDLHRMPRAAWLERVVWPALLGAAQHAEVEELLRLSVWKCSCGAINEGTNVCGICRASRVLSTGAPI